MIRYALNQWLTDGDTDTYMDDYYSENPFTGFFPDNIEKVEPWKQPKQTPQRPQQVPQRPSSRTAVVPPYSRNRNPEKMTISFGTGQGEPTVMVNGRPMSPNQANSNSPFNFEFSTTNNQNPSANRNVNDSYNFLIF